eukprot:TRINITY_DN382_c0_g1_i1.p1 TRINITY_DN382_c0_g1~~TRINITY_DN382_c0_g1_i1.p1  ORF type:complete len:208 (+),score=42.69 TRINITY_DN382_c0_g1_i1:66-689(+)
MATIATKPLFTKEYSYECFKGFKTLLEPKALLISGLKSALMVGSKGAPKVETAPKFFITAFLFDTAISFTRCCIHYALDLYATPQFVSKFTRDIGRSAIRKYARSGSKLTAAGGMFLTAMRAGVVTNVSALIVKQIHYTWNFVTQVRAGGLKKEDALVYWNQTQKHIFTCLLSILFGGIGAVVGTIISPGKGTILWSLVGESIACAL